MNQPKSPTFSKGFWIVIILFAIAVLVIGLPNLIKARCTSCFNACVNNLRQLDSAANQFALEHSKTNGETINFPNDLTPYIKLNSQGKIPGCPQGGVYSIWRVGRTPACSLGDTVIPGHTLQ